MGCLLSDTGGHCVYHYGWHQKTVECLDDGTGRLIKLSRTPLNASRYAHNVSVARFGSADDDITFFEEEKKKKAIREKRLSNMTIKEKLLHKKNKKKERKKNKNIKKRENGWHNEKKSGIIV